MQLRALINNYTKFLEEYGIDKRIVVFEYGSALVLQGVIKSIKTLTLSVPELVWNGFRSSEDWKETTFIEDDQVDIDQQHAEHILQCGNVRLIKHNYDLSTIKGPREINTRDIRELLVVAESDGVFGNDDLAEKIRLHLSKNSPVSKA